MSLIMVLFPVFHPRQVVQREGSMKGQEGLNDTNSTGKLTSTSISLLDFDLSAPNRHSKLTSSLMPALMTATPVRSPERGQAQP